VMQKLLTSANRSPVPPRLTCVTTNRLNWRAAVRLRQPPKVSGQPYHHFNEPGDPNQSLVFHQPFESSNREEPAIGSPQNGGRRGPSLKSCSSAA